MKALAPISTAPGSLPWSSRGVTRIVENSRNDLIGKIADLHAQEAALAAQKAELIDQARQWSEVVEAASTTSDRIGGWDPATVARKHLVTELAAALRMPERSVETLVAESEILVHELIGTFNGLLEGKFSYQHAKVILDHAYSLPEDARELFEDDLLPHAARLTRAKLERKARTLREQSHPESIQARTEEAVERRFVEIEPARDGMAYLTAYLPAVEATAIYNRLTDMALALNTKDEPRTLTQLRTDQLTRLLCDGVFPDSGSIKLNGIRPTVLVTVPVLSLLKEGEEPATLEGYGPIDAETARQVAANAPHFYRILTHPETGTVLSVGRAHV